MVTSKAARTTLDLKVFDFNSVMARTKSPKPKSVPVFLRADLADRIIELQSLLDGDASDGTERAIGDPEPGAELLDEYNALVDDFNESKLVFEFRATKLSDNTNAKAAMIRDGHDLESDTAQEVSIGYMLAERCENAGWSGAEWHQWREQIGEAAFRPLINTAVEADTSGVSAPFSRRLSPGRTSEKPS